ncbi:DUF1249 domain-containing protein [Nitrincola alkalilacustris]|uniref:DUF1249 domain-containing protein n=1 Tax=Nitrincola alkalilacustris TaxID=1571224 RepID=UPI00124BEAF2|nr:DUF1249 domain-containing protein [Nitrincola alkalilacustris]
MKRKYVPDLTRQMAQCQINYARIMKLLPDFESCDEREFRVGIVQQQAVVRIEIDERFRYTSTLLLSYVHESDSRWLEAPQLIVRLYHDARMAEVICLKRRRQLSGVYPYPNGEMHQPDEKQQLNQYLGEWLNLCLDHGFEMEPVLAD